MEGLAQLQMSLAAYARELGLNIHSYGCVLTGVMTGVTLALGVEGALPSVLGTTCTPSTVVGVEFGPEAAAAEEGTDPGVPVEIGAEVAALESAEGSVEVDAELEPEANASTVGEVAAKELEDELAIIVVEELSAVETASLLAPAPVEVARTELVVVFTTNCGESSTSGSAATNTKATFCTPEMPLPDEFEGAAWGVSTERTVELPGAVLGVEVTFLVSTSVAPARDAS